MDEIVTRRARGCSDGDAGVCAVSNCAKTVVKLEALQGPMNVETAEAEVVAGSEEGGEKGFGQERRSLRRWWM